MTKEMQELIDRDLNAALESGDAKLVVQRDRARHLHGQERDRQGGSLTRGKGETR